MVGSVRIADATSVAAPIISTVRRLSLVKRLEISTRKRTAGLRELILFQIERAESYFRAAEPLLGELSFDARFPTLLMGGIYGKVLRRLRPDPAIVLERRVSLSPLSKAGVVFSRLFHPRFL